MNLKTIFLLFTTLRVSLFLNFVSLISLGMFAWHQEAWNAKEHDWRIGIAQRSVANSEDLYGLKTIYDDNSKTETRLSKIEKDQHDMSACVVKVYSNLLLLKFSVDGDKKINQMTKDLDASQAVLEKSIMEMEINDAKSRADAADADAIDASFHR